MLGSWVQCLAAALVSLPLEAGGRRLYIVDDDAAVRDALSRVGEVLGLSVAAFPSARAFLARYDAARPGPLILDLGLPGMDGLALQQELRRRNIELPIIVVTGHGDRQAIRRARAAGALTVLRKPFDLKELIACIQQALDRFSES